MNDDDRYVLPDQLTFHASVFNGCIAKELISFTIVWFMFWAIVLGFLALVAGIGVIAIAPIILFSVLSVLITTFVVRSLRNNRPAGALGQMIAKKFDRAGFFPCRFIVDPDTFTASRSKQLVCVGAQLVGKLPVEERSSVLDFDGFSEEY